MKELTEQELNVFLAEHVFGITNHWGIHKGGWFYKQDCCGYVLNSRIAGRFSKEEADQHCKHCEELKSVMLPVESYTTDPAAAMLVLERCCKFSANACDIRENAGEWRVACSSWHSYESAPTLPLAICRFAYKLFK